MVPTSRENYVLSAIPAEPLMDAPATLRVVVSDPQPVFLHGLKELIDRTDNLRVVAQAADPIDAVDAVRRLDADVLVVHAGAGGRSLDALRTPGALPTRVRCIIVTDGADQGAGLAATNPSVGCVLPRESSGRAFLHCIECVVRNQCWPVRQCAVDAPPPPPKPEPVARRYRLTGRETQIVAAVADGSSNKDIAAQLAISEDTVKHHMSNIFDKVGVHSRLELAVFALYHGVVTMGGV